MSSEQKMEAEELRFNLPDIAIAGKAWGDPMATINVIAIHGFMDNASTFDRLAPLLVQHNENIRIVALDFSGHGKSQHRPDNSSYFVSWVTEVVTVADALGWDSFSLLAHSMGGGVGILIAGAVPSRVKHLILIDSIGSRGIAPEETPKQFEMALKERHRLLSRQPRVYETVDQIIERMMNKSVTRLTKESAKILVERNIERVHGGWRYSHDPRLQGFSRMVNMTEPELLAFIQRITARTLLIWASERTFTINMKVAESRISHFKDITVQNVIGNHHVHLEDPKQVDTMIGDFLADKTPSRL